MKRAVDPAVRPEAIDPRFYGRRRGRPLRAARRAALALCLEPLSMRLPEDAGIRIDPRCAFDPPQDRVWLEIGFGAGEHLLGQAERERDVGLIGCEPFVNGVAAVVAAVSATGTDGSGGGLKERVRIFADDARLLLPRLVPASVERVFVLFPDPWPKRRHRRRRLFNEATIDALADVLNDGGELRFATDHDDYAVSTLALIMFHPAFVWAARRPVDWRQPPVDWVPTRYEMKARAAARTPLFFRFIRRRRGENPVDR